METSLDGEVKRNEKEKIKKSSLHRNRFLPTTRSTGLPMAFLILSLAYHRRLRISHIRFAQASSHAASHAFASNVMPCTSHVALLLGKLQHGHIHSPVHVNPLCSEHSDNNSHPLSLACQQIFSNLGTLQR